MDDLAAQQDRARHIAAATLEVALEIALAEVYARVAKARAYHFDINADNTSPPLLDGSAYRCCAECGDGVPDTWPCETLLALDGLPSREGS